jgi:hypothetical protein
VFIPFQLITEAGAEVHNIRCMFIAGLCDGMGKPKLLLGPPGFEAPLDVRDDVKQWHQLSDIHTIVADGVGRRKPGVLLGGEASIETQSGSSSTTESKLALAAARTIVTGLKNSSKNI